MNSVPVRKAKANFSAIIEAAEKGQTITVTNRGRPVAVIGPFILEGDGARPGRSFLPRFEQALLSVPHNLVF
jgi:prevent-host-death family protein